MLLTPAKHAEHSGKEGIVKTVDGDTYISHGDLHNFSARHIPGDKEILLRKNVDRIKIEFITHFRVIQG